jgi:hypothetical protein
VGFRLILNDGDAGVKSETDSPDGASLAFRLMRRHNTGVFGISLN